MNDVLVCCDECKAPNGCPVVLVTDAPGNGWCPKCGKRWEDIRDAAQRKVEAEDHAGR